MIKSSVAVVECVLEVWIRQQAINPSKDFFNNFSFPSTEKASKFGNVFFYFFFFLANIEQENVSFIRIIWAFCLYTYRTYIVYWINFIPILCHRRQRHAFILLTFELENSFLFLSCWRMWFDFLFFFLCYKKCFISFGKWTFLKIFN